MKDNLTSQKFLTAGALTHPVLMEIILNRVRLKPSYQLSIEAGLRGPNEMNGMGSGNW